MLGTKWIDKLLPPVVIGPMIMIIGLGLAPSAISQIGLATGTDLQWKEILVALVSFLVTAIVAVRGKGFLKIIPFLIRNYIRICCSNLCRTCRFCTCFRS